MLTVVKERLDQYLVKEGLVQSRERGKALIMAGQVFVNSIRIDKPGTGIKADDKIEIKGETLPYVSRGGLKLEKAINSYQLDLHEKVILDIGASTGGFTDCALQNGASLVYAVDVGYGQLDWKLRQDKRVITIERKNARYLSSEDIPEPVDFVTIDVSFISLTKVFPAILPLMKVDGQIISLIKPQFEAGRDKVGKKGVVKDKKTHCEVILKIVDFAKKIGFIPLALQYSPITGPNGNIEFLMWSKKNSESNVSYITIDTITELVEEAHASLS